MTSARKYAALAVAGWAAAVVALAAAAPSASVPAAPVPAFSPEGGAFKESVSVRLATDAGVVRYTVDGSEPTEHSPVYSKPINLRATTLIKARIFSAGREPGPVRSRTFVVIDKELEKFTSNLPLVIINTFGRAIERENKVPVSARFIGTNAGRSSLLGSADFDGRGLFNYRGNTSLRYLKRSYAFKTQGDDSKTLEGAILGFPIDSDWILYAPYPDKTLMRDVLAYEMFSQMGRYASRTKFVEVFVNETGSKLTQRDYMGVFVFEEKIKRSKDRVNVQKLGTNDNTTPNVTGGYIFKKDHADRTGPVVPTEDGWPNMGGGGSTQRYGYPTGPGDFPADPGGFLPSLGGRTESTSRRTARGRSMDENSRSITNRDRSVRVWQDGRVTIESEPPRQESLYRRLLENLFQPARPNRDDRRTWPQAVPPEAAIDRWGFRSSGQLRFSSGEEMFITSRGNQFFYVEPKQEEITPAQKAWLQEHLNQLEAALYGPSFTDPVRGYAAYIDPDSFIDQHLIIEVTKNIDGFRFSTFFSKDRGGKIRMEPIWDWNLAFGNCNGKQGWMPEYWYWPQLDDQQYSWFRRLFEDPDFGQRYVDRWGQLCQTVFARARIHARIDALAGLLEEAQRRNFERWPILGKKIWPNYYVGQSFEAEVRWMKDWIAKRLAWIDRQFVAAPTLREDSGGPTRNAALSAREGNMFYTLDGSDPRAPGGEISPKAAQYIEPIKLPPHARFFARAKVENRWSPPTRRDFQ